MLTSGPQKKHTLLAMEFLYKVVFLTRPGAAVAQPPSSARVAGQRGGSAAAVRPTAASDLTLGFGEQLDRKLA